MSKIKDWFKRKGMALGIIIASFILMFVFLALNSQVGVSIFIITFIIGIFYLIIGGRKKR